MKLAFYTQRNKEVGWGHWYRTRALSTTAGLMGHECFIFSDVRQSEHGLGDRFVFISSDQLVQATQNNLSFASIKKIEKTFDWLVFDMPWSKFDYRYLIDVPLRTCIIEGIGTYAEDAAEVTIGQGFKGEYCAPEYLILSPELAEFNIKKARENLWYVWGGAADKLDLLRTFSRVMPSTPALLVFTNFCPPFEPSLKSRRAGELQHIQVPASNVPLFDVMSRSSNACVAMGITAWELICLGVPTYVFSHDERQLETTLEMAARGWVRPHPEVGLPNDETMAQILESEFVPAGDYVSPRGAFKVIELLEEKK